MYITNNSNKYILWSDKRKVVHISDNKDEIYEYMNVLIDKKNKSNRFNSWVYMCFKYNIVTG